MEASPCRIFISYSRTDGREFVAKANDIVRRCLNPAQPCPGAVRSMRLLMQTLDRGQPLGWQFDAPDWAQQCYKII
jgi:hypothetical protein